MGKFRLDRRMFGEKEEVLLSAGDLTISTFRFGSGIEALRIRGLHTTLVILPFRGQQIWSAEITGVNITMRSGAMEPKARHNFLESFGSFFVHCGLKAIGAPAAGDTHRIPCTVSSRWPQWMKHGSASKNLPKKQSFALADTMSISIFLKHIIVPLPGSNSAARRNNSKSECPWPI